MLSSTATLLRTHFLRRNLRRTTPAGKQMSSFDEVPREVFFGNFCVVISLVRLDAELTYPVVLVLPTLRAESSDLVSCTVRRFVTSTYFRIGSDKADGLELHVHHERRRRECEARLHKAQREDRPGFHGGRDRTAGRGEEYLAEAHRPGLGAGFRHRLRATAPSSTTCLRRCVFCECILEEQPLLRPRKKGNFRKGMG